MRRDSRDFLKEILRAIEDAEEITTGIDLQTFASNKEKLYSTIHCLEIIGEAVKSLPSEIKVKYAQIPWKKIAGMRDKLIHGYFSVDSERVWITVKRDLPPLKEIIKEILNDME
ncbi:hypothetical protein BMS3Bbin15_00539 [archaeon BMS3Bbin15]|nr:hypothetical protein BMS3Bbin15_00539 [archaeon BMS3Bbin15]